MNADQSPRTSAAAGAHVFAAITDMNGIFRGKRVPAEKLSKLETLPSDGFMVACFPVKVHRGSAGWTRAVAVFND